MQNGKQIYFKDRSLYYAANPIREQGRKGKAKAAAEAKALEVKLAKSGVKDVKNKKVKKGWDYHLKDVYLVAIMDFIFPGNEYPDNEYYHMVKLMDVKDKHVFYGKLTLIYLEMPKLKDMAFHLETMREKWMYALYSLCYTDERPPELQEEVFQKLFHEAELANFNETQLFSYEMSVLDLWNNYSTWECANQEGIEEGIAKAQLDHARKMKALGMATKIITQVTGLPADAIEKLG